MPSLLYSVAGNIKTSSALPPSPQRVFRVTTLTQQGQFKIQPTQALRGYKATQSYTTSANSFQMCGGHWQRFSHQFIACKQAIESMNLETYSCKMFPVTSDWNGKWYHSFEMRAAGGRVQFTELKNTHTGWLSICSACDKSLVYSI